MPADVVKSIIQTEEHPKNAFSTARDVLRAQVAILAKIALVINYDTHRMLFCGASTDFTRGVFYARDIVWMSHRGYGACIVGSQLQWCAHFLQTLRCLWFTKWFGRFSLNVCSTR
jgi:hypothetical protein